MQVNLFIAVLKIKFAKAQTLFHSKLAKLSRKKRKNVLARVMEKSKNRIKDQVKKRREASEVSMVLLHSGLRTVPPCLQQMAGEAVADLHGFPRLKPRYGRVCHQEPHGGQHAHVQQRVINANGSLLFHNFTCLLCANHSASKRPDINGAIVCLHRSAEFL